MRGNEAKNKLGAFIFYIQKEQSAYSPTKWWRREISTNHKWYFVNLSLKHKTVSFLYLFVLEKAVNSTLDTME